MRGGEKTTGMPPPAARQPRALPRPPAAAESKGRSRFNYGSASKRDALVFGSERPGQPKPNPDTPVTPRGPLVAAHIVDQWAAHMRSKGIRRALCLLNEAELAFYAEPLLAQLDRHFRDAAGNADDSGAANPPRTATAPSSGPTSKRPDRVTHIMPHADTALADIMACLDAAVASKEPIVVFCSTGQARTGMILAFWLHRQYSLTVAAAVTEVAEHALSQGAVRKPSVEQVLQFSIGAEARSMLPKHIGGGAGGGGIGGVGGGSGGGGIAFATPRADDRLHITFVQTGGTIDKDYPRLMAGYAFEITEPAVGRILKQVNCGFTHDVVTVCRKDSQDIAVEDRQAIVEAVRRARDCDKFIVTHGTDTMIETAEYVAAAKGKNYYGISLPQPEVDL